MTLQEINDKWGSYLWRVANNYHTGIWDAEDVYNDLLIKLHLAFKSGEVVDDGTVKARKRIISFIISKGINIVRMENRRQRQLKRNISAVLVMCGVVCDGGELVNSRPDYDEERREMELKEMVHSRLSERDATFICELAFPSAAVVNHAIGRQLQNQVATGLKMNTRNLKITTVDVVEALELNISPATKTRIRQNANWVLLEAEINGRL